jgi:hypothetical protein
MAFDLTVISYFSFAKFRNGRYPSSPSFRVQGNYRVGKFKATFNERAKGQSGTAGLLDIHLHLLPPHNPNN